MNGELKIFSGNSNKPLAKKIAKKIDINLGEITVGKFQDGEINVKYDESVRGCDLFLIQSTNPPAENLVELLLMIDAAKKSSAKRITAVIPYFGYARQDKKDKPRTSISAKLVANLITTAGADRILTLDLHSDSIQGFFDIPFDHLFSSYFFVPYLSKIIKDKKNTIIVAPDIGSSKRSGKYAEMLDVELAVIDKKRMGPNKIEKMTLMGDVKDKNVLLIDDLIDTSGTLCEATKKLKKNNVNSIIVACTHPLLSKNALNKLYSLPVSKFIFSDTIKQKTSQLAKLQKNIPTRFKNISSSSLLGETIKRIHCEESVSTLFINQKN